MVEKSSIQLEIEGIQAVTDKLEQVTRDLHGSPMLEGMREATLIVTRQSKLPDYVPVKTGRLRASIRPEIRQSGKIVRGVVYSNVRYAAFQEARKQYLQRALDDTLEKIKKFIGDVVSRIVEK